MFLRRKGKIKLKKLHFEVQIHLKLLINFFDWVPILKHIHAWSEWIALMTWCPTQRFHVSLSITLLKNWRFPILGKYIIRVKKLTISNFECVTRNLNWVTICSYLIPIMCWLWYLAKFDLVLAQWPIPDCICILSYVQCVLIYIFIFSDLFVLLVHPNNH